MIGSDLKAWRGEYRYTQAALAIDLDVSRQTVVGWEGSETALPRMLELALKELERRRKVDGQRMSASEQVKMRTEARTLEAEVKAGLK